MFFSTTLFLRASIVAVTQYDQRKVGRKSFILSYVEGTDPEGMKDAAYTLLA